MLQAWGLVDVVEMSYVYFGNYVWVDILLLDGFGAMLQVGELIDVVEISYIFTLMVKSKIILHIPRWFEMIYIGKINYTHRVNQIARNLNYRWVN